MLFDPFDDFARIRRPKLEVTLILLPQKGPDRRPVVKNCTNASEKGGWFEVMQILMHEPGKQGSLCDPYIEEESGLLIAENLSERGGQCVGAIDKDCVVTGLRRYLLLRLSSRAVRFSVHE